MGIDMSKYKADGNTTDLKAKDFVGKNLKVTISRIETVDYEARDDAPANTKPALYFEGKDKRLILNGSNTEILCGAYGSDSDLWVGKAVILTTKDYTSKGYGHGWIVTPLDVELSDDIPF